MLNSIFVATMATGFFNTPVPKNEPVKSYAPGTSERKELQDTLSALRAVELDIPMYIGGTEVRSGERIRMAPPHDHQHTLGYFHKSSKTHVNEAINAALSAKASWAHMPWEHRASIFLKAAELIAGPYRSRLNAAPVRTGNKFSSL